MNLANDKKYNVKIIFDNKVNANRIVSKLSDLYYLISKKSYNKSKITWKSALVVINLKKIMSFFYKKYLKKPITTFLFTKFAFLMIKISYKQKKVKIINIKIIKQNRVWLIKISTKRVKNKIYFNFYLY